MQGFTIEKAGYEQCRGHYVYRGQKRYEMKISDMLWYEVYQQQSQKSKKVAWWIAQRQRNPQTGKIEPTFLYTCQSKTDFPPSENWSKLKAGIWPAPILLPDGAIESRRNFEGRGTGSNGGHIQRNSFGGTGRVDDPYNNRGVEMSALHEERDQQLLRFVTQSFELENMGYHVSQVFNLLKQSNITLEELRGFTISDLMQFGLTREQADIIIKQYPLHPQQPAILEGNRAYLGQDEMVTRVSLFWGAIFFVACFAWGVEEAFRISEYRDHPSTKTWHDTFGEIYSSGMSLPAITLCQKNANILFHGVSYLWYSDSWNCEQGATGTATDLSGRCYEPLTAIPHSIFYFDPRTETECNANITDTECFRCKVLNYDGQIKMYKVRDQYMMRWQYTPDNNLRFQGLYLGLISQNGVNGGSWKVGEYEDDFIKRLFSDTGRELLHHMIPINTETVIDFTYEQRMMFDESGEFNLPSLFAPDPTPKVEDHWRVTLQQQPDPELEAGVDPAVSLIFTMSKDEVFVSQEYRAQSFRDIPAHSGGILFLVCVLFFIITQFTFRGSWCTEGYAPTQFFNFHSQKVLTEYLDYQLSTRYNLKAFVPAENPDMAASFAKSKQTFGREAWNSWE